MTEVLRAADQRRLLSHEHFTVDSTLLEAWACHKSGRPKDDPSPSSTGGTKHPALNVRWEKRSHANHQSVFVPEARIARKSNGRASILGHLGSVLMDNRHGLIVATDVRAPGDDAERDAAVTMLRSLPPRQRRCTLGADMGYDSAALVAGARACGVTPHVAQNIHARKSTSAIDNRATRHAGYAMSQVKRTLVEEAFGWGKIFGGLRKLHHQGRAKVRWLFASTNAAYNLVRMRTLLRVGVAT